MKKKYYFICLALVLMFFQLQAQENNIIPIPNKTEYKKGMFKFSSCTALLFDKNDAEIEQALAPLVTKFKKAASIDLLSPSQCDSKSQLSVSLDPSISNEEGYQLQVGEKEISISAKKPVGIFYAVETLLQLLPEEIESAAPQPKVNWEVPCVTIEDAPRFAYRGIMLDAARHFMPVDSIKRILDLLAMQKMNRFHWHLTDNQGWRFESKKYPKLVEIGAYRKGSPMKHNVTYNYNSLPNDSLYGGYYTQQQMKEVVQYAADRFITIIPEIEMPAHAESAIASYPELACVDSAGQPFPYPQDIQGEFCTKDETINFLTDILSEVIEIFPSHYIHIGGDEADKENWKTCKHCQKIIKGNGLQNVQELQSYFIKRIEAFVNSKGRSIIGWDEIMEGGIAPNAAVMSWTGIKSGIEAAKQHHEVVMAPLPYSYFDHAQSAAPGEPEAYPGLTMLNNVYDYEPVPAALTPEQAKFIKGAQANLWSEYVPTASHAEYMLFPRAIALAEVTWANPEQKNFSDFTRRLLHYNKRLNFHQVNYSRHMYDIRLSNLEKKRSRMVATISGSENGAPIYYTLDGSIPDKKSAKYKRPLTISKSATLTAAILNEGKVIDMAVKDYIMHKAVGKKISYKIPPDYNKSGLDGLVNGSLADDVRFNDYRNEDEERYNDDKWLGWNDKVLEATIDLGKSEKIDSVNMRFYHNVPFGIFIPKSVTLQLSADGVNFEEVAAAEIELPKATGAVPLAFPLTNKSTRFIRVIAEPYGKTPAGNNAELFIDEIIVK